MSQPHNTIRSWALAAVAITSVAMIVFAWWLIGQLASPDWCNRALGASEYVNGRPEFAITACTDLLMRQVRALAFNSHMAIGTLALSLLVLVVIVLAGGRLSFTASKEGVSGNIGQAADPGKAAQFVADQAQDAANEVGERGAPDAGAQQGGM